MLFKRWTRETWLLAVPRAFMLPFLTPFPEHLPHAVTKTCPPSLCSIKTSQPCRKNTPQRRMSCETNINQKYDKHRPMSWMKFLCWPDSHEPVHHNTIKASGTSAGGCQSGWVLLTDNNNRNPSPLSDIYLRKITCVLIGVHTQFSRLICFIVVSVFIVVCVCLLISRCLHNPRGTKAGSQTSLPLS